jgi:hypothetical protein
VCGWSGIAHIPKPFLAIGSLGQNMKVAYRSLNELRLLLGVWRLDLLGSAVSLGLSTLYLDAYWMPVSVLLGTPLPFELSHESLATTIISHSPRGVRGRPSEIFQYVMRIKRSGCEDGAG